ncbi:Abi family protein [Rothia sp. BD8]|uniref:Abi family protein n=1 Tax=Rothia sp. BD8 TaxID=2953894 RepID=UPI00383D365C
MSKAPYTKPSLSLRDQALRLRSRGLDAPAEKIELTLRRMSYYRLAGYLWWFYGEEWEVLEPGATLDEVLRLYDFDAQLRSQIMRLSHSIEAWLRAAMTNHLGQAHGPMGYLDETLYSSAPAFRRDRRKLEECMTGGAPEQFIEEFRNKYQDPLPPIWMAAEIMSLGLLSKWYDNLREDSLRKGIARECGLPPEVLSRFLRVFTVLRNRSAHHARVWNRRTSLRVATIRRLPGLLEPSLAGADTERINYPLSLAVFIVRTVDPSASVIRDLHRLLLGADESWLTEMDIPEGMAKDPLWFPDRAV